MGAMGERGEAGRRAGGQRPPLTRSRVARHAAGMHQCRGPLKPEPGSETGRGGVMKRGHGVGLGSRYEWRQAAAQAGHGTAMTAPGVDSRGTH